MWNNQTYSVYKRMMQKRREKIFHLYKLSLSILFDIWSLIYMIPFLLLIIIYFINFLREHLKPVNYTASEFMFWNILLFVGLVLFSSFYAIINARYTWSVSDYKLCYYPIDLNSYFRLHIFFTQLKRASILFVLAMMMAVLLPTKGKAGFLRTNVSSLKCCNTP